MSDVALPTFVRKDLAAERAAPIKTTGVVGFLRTRLFNSPTNILLTIAGALLIWFTVVPALQFLLVDAVWQGADRNACLEQNAGHPVGACWPYIAAKFDQFIYGFYPQPERWRANLTFLLGALLLLPLLIPRLPAKGLNASLFFVAFPVVAFFLLHGGGLDGFGVSWTASLLSGPAGQLRERRQCADPGWRRERGHRPAIVGARQAGRPDRHGDLARDLAADLAARPDAGFGTTGVVRLRGDRGRRSRRSPSISAATRGR